MTRKRIGQGLLEVFSTTCDSCGGRGHHVSLHLPEAEAKPVIAKAGKRKGKGVDPADVIAKSASAGSEAAEPEAAEAEVPEAETAED